MPRFVIADYTGQRYIRDTTTDKLSGPYFNAPEIAAQWNRATEAMLDEANETAADHFHVGRAATIEQATARRIARNKMQAADARDASIMRFLMRYRGGMVARAYAERRA